jgi:hypothetical protein
VSDDHGPGEHDHERLQLHGVHKYWAVDFPGLTAEGAAELLRLSAERGIAGVAADPDLFLTMHLDRATAEAIAQALAGAQGNVARGTLEIVTEWLQNRR